MSLRARVHSAIGGDSTKLKEDQSVFTIADGLVQGLLKKVVFGDKFAAIVGEEDDASIVVHERPVSESVAVYSVFASHTHTHRQFKVDELVVPARFELLIETTREHLRAIGARLSSVAYKELTVFIDPIDGTREFATKLGEQCTICVGFARNSKPWAGVVYRPVPTPTSWAAGCAEQRLRMAKLHVEATPRAGLLTSNGAISPFLESLMAELKCDRVPSGGAGNKMLMLLERKASCYVQDRGVSRWDTCAAQACLEAHGGMLCKLAPFMSAAKTLASYHYAASAHNLDFEPNVAALTKYNAAKGLRDSNWYVCPRLVPRRTTSGPCPALTCCAPPSSVE